MSKTPQPAGKGRNTNMSQTTRPGKAHPNQSRSSFANQPQASTSHIEKQMRNVSLGGPFLRANHFPVTVGDIKTVYRYDLEMRKVQPPSEHIPAAQRKRVVWLVVETLLDQNKDAILATNYKNQIISAHELKTGVGGVPMTIHYRDEYQQEAPTTHSVFEITFVPPKPLSLTDLQASLQPNTPPFADSGDVIAALNIIFSYQPYTLCIAKQDGVTVRSEKSDAQKSGSQKSDPTSQRPVALIQSRQLPQLTTTDGNKFFGIVNPPLPCLTGGPFKVAGAMEHIPGFVRGIRTVKSAFGQINLIVNTATAIFYPHGTVEELITSWLSLPQNRYPVGTIEERLEYFIRDLRVRTQNVKDIPDVLDEFQTTILGFASASNLARGSVASNCRMICRGKTLKSTVADHFECPGNVRVVKTGGRNSLTTFPVNNLWIVPGQPNLQTSEKPYGAIRTPVVNRDMILGTGRELFYGTGTNAQGAVRFGLGLGTEMVPVRPISLPAPDLLFRASPQPERGNNQATTPQPERGNPTLNPRILSSSQVGSGKWNLGAVSFHTPANAMKWTLLELRLPRAQGCSDQGLSLFKDSLQKAMLSCGMQNWTFVRGNGEASQNCTQHRFDLLHHQLPKSHQHHEAARQYDHIGKKLSESKDKIKLIVILLPEKDYELYAAIKRAADNVLGIATVCLVMTRRVPQGLMPKTDLGTLANICMKMNLKVDTRTVNQALKSKPPILQDRTMIIGIDVTHAPGTGAPSIAAVVGSVDQHFAQWPASLKTNYASEDRKQSKEQVNDLDSMILERLEYFYERNKLVPDRILVYRDGLSEGQFPMCRTQEYRQIQCARDRFLQGKAASEQHKARIVLICAVKRHHTRLFPDPGGNSVGLLTPNNNPRPGTMVDDTITYGDGQDFYLVSQNAIMGTARPTHYVILANETTYQTREIAKATNDLCYLFGRSVTSVGVCTAAYYADLAADRARFYVSKFYRPQFGRGVFDRSVNEAEFNRLLHGPNASLTPYRRCNMFYL